MTAASAFGRAVVALGVAFGLPGAALAQPDEGAEAETRPAPQPSPPRGAVGPGVMGAYGPQGGARPIAPVPMYWMMPPGAPGMMMPYGPVGPGAMGAYGPQAEGVPRGPNLMLPWTGPRMTEPMVQQGMPHRAYGPGYMGPYGPQTEQRETGEAGAASGDQPGVFLGWQVIPPLRLSTDDVRFYFERQLEHRGYDRLEVGAIEEVDADTITVEIVTVDGSLVQRLAVDRNTGLISRAG